MTCSAGRLRPEPDPARDLDQAAGELALDDSLDELDELDEPDSLLDDEDAGLPDEELRLSFR